MREIRIYRARKPNTVYGNFGDEITITILERLLSIRAIPVEMHKADLIGAGSILDHYSRSRKKRERLTPDEKARHRSETSSILHVWGTGLQREHTEIEWPQAINLCAVRGRLTAARVNADGITLGDPGILASGLLDHRPTKAWSVGLVAHYVDTDWVSSLDLPNGWQAINPELPVLDVVSRIASAELVISSSLHGLIVADSLGIPCIWATTYTRTLAGTPGYKFHDHASARGVPFNAPISYAEAMSMGEARLSTLATTPARPVAEWQESILHTFPIR